jgi:2-polyprenyl-3-methyl-5-hydroxy-6-metoxy-1,4-benzoquinol methylase
MINFSDRLKTEKIIFENILSEFPAKTALDAGCGSGFHTIVLSQLKLIMTGMDNSDHMLNLAKRNSNKHNVTPSFLKNDFLSLNATLKNRYDAVYCLGNSFVHLLSDNDQINALSNFRTYLRPEGYLCLQIINYDKILKNRQEILAVREVNNNIITRLYSFNQSTITFTVKVETNDECKEYSTELYPMQSEELLSYLRKSGFNKLSLYGDLKLNSYHRFKSDNICIFCNLD